MGTNNRKKNLKDIKGLDKAHPYSRKAIQMKRVIQRIGLKEEKGLKKDFRNMIKYEKLMWFKNYICDLPMEKLPFGADEMREMVKEYINRNFYLIKDLKATIRQGRPKPQKLVLLENLKESETREFKAGSLEVPDFTILKVAEYIIKWDGDMNAISFITHTWPKMEDDEKKLILQAIEKTQPQDMNVDLVEQ